MDLKGRIGLLSPALLGLLFNISVVQAANLEDGDRLIEPVDEKLELSQAADAEPVEAMRKRLIVRKADEAKQMSNDTEREQLIKAQEASAATQAREKKIWKRQKSGEWQETQLEKAKAEFNNRRDRESKYLNDAKAAAKRERKIPKSK